MVALYNTLSILSIFCSIPLFHSTIQLFNECEMNIGYRAPSIENISEKSIIEVASQSQFDNLSKLIGQAFKTSSNIEVIFKKGTYYYTDDHIIIYNYNNPDLSIRIDGKGSIMIPKGDFHRINNVQIKDSRNYVFLTKSNKCVSLYSEFKQSDRPIEIVDKPNKLCRIYVSHPIPIFEDTYIQIPHWYKCSTYKAIKYQDGYMYFYAPDLEYVPWKGGYNINDDLFYAKSNPRYSIVEGIGQKSFLESCREIYQCKAGRFAYVTRNTLRSFDICGFSFIGSSNDKPVIEYHINTADRLSVSDCSFAYLKNHALSVSSCQNLLFARNHLHDLFGDGVFIQSDSKNVEICENEFKNLGIDNTPCYDIICKCTDYHIWNNIFEDFNYVAIYVGHGKSGEDPDPYGIIEHNSFYYSDNYLANIRGHSFIDGGAIYVNRVNEKAIIRFNYVHDISGVGSNRGIYCDDGAKNVIIYGNVIRNIQNDYALFSWRSYEADKVIKDANTGIYVFYNIIWGEYFLDEKGESLRAHNIILKSDIEDRKEIVANNVYELERDIFNEDAKMIRGKVSVSRITRKVIKKMPVYVHIKKWVR